MHESTYITLGSLLVNAMHPYGCPPGSASFRLLVPLVPSFVALDDLSIPCNARGC